MHRSNQRAKIMNQPLLLAFALAGFAFSIHAQPSSAPAGEPKVIIRVEPMAPEKEEPPAIDPALGEGRAGPTDCEQKFPMPPSKKASVPYVEDGSIICKRLVVRGQQMQCEIEKLINDRSGVFATTGAKTELANWARCNEKIASLLVGGYYLPASEIERRLQICSSNFYADPGKPPKLGSAYTRFMRWVTSNDLTPPPSDAALEAAIKQSTPLNSQENVAGLMQCEWMFSTSKTPQIDPLPSLTPAGAQPAAKTPINTKPPVKKPSN
jgi:hypothetical protein